MYLKIIIKFQEAPPGNGELHISRFPKLSFYTTAPSFTPGPLGRMRLKLMAKKYGTIYWRVGGLKSSDEITNFRDYLLDLKNPRFTQHWSFTIQ